MRADLKRLNQHIAISVSSSKAKWHTQICSKIHNMSFNPRVAWEHIGLLTKGETAHYQKHVHMERKKQTPLKTCLYLVPTSPMYSTTTAPSIPTSSNTSHNVAPYGNSATPSPGKSSVKQFVNSKMQRHQDSQVSHQKRSK